MIRSLVYLEFEQWKVKRKYLCGLVRLWNDRVDPVKVFYKIVPFLKLQDQLVEWDEHTV